MNNIILPERKFVELLDFNQTTTDVLAIGWNACLDEVARLNQPTAGAGVVVGALVSALEGIVHDERVPNEVSQDYAALLIEARRLNHCRAQAVPDGLFFKDSQELAEALGDVKCLHDMSVELIAERVFTQRGEC